MAKSPLAAVHDDHGGHHIHDNSMYVKTAGALALLMILTIGAARVDIGHIIGSRIGLSSHFSYYINNFIALAIAAVKTYIVVMYFMHVKWISSLGKLFALMGFFFIPVLFSVWTDFYFRQHEPVAHWYNNDYSESATPRIIGSTDGAKINSGEENTQNRIPKSIW
ncbi:MAG: cytochrome C oxidase subunit IV family protein [Armatimonadota bacterium]